MVLALGAWTVTIGPVAAVRTGRPVGPVPALRPVAVGAGPIRPIIATAIGRSPILARRAVGTARPVGIPRGPIVCGITPASGLRRTPLEGLAWFVRAAGRGRCPRRPVGAAALGRSTGTTAAIGALVGAILLTGAIDSIRSVATCPAVGPALVVSCWAIAGPRRTVPAFTGRFRRTFGAVAVGRIGHDVRPVVGILILSRLLEIQKPREVTRIECV